MIGRPVWLALSGATAAAVLAVTLFPVPSPDPAPGVGPEAVRFLCLVCGQFGAADFLLNVAFFVPLGVFVHLAAGERRGLLLALLTGLALSAAIEAGQLLVPGRFSTLGDLVANTAGAGLGGLAVRWRARLLRPGRRGAGRLSLAAGAAAGGVFLLTGWLLTPSPTGERNWVQWTPVLGHYEAYRGRVVRARLGGLSLSPGRMDPAASTAARRAVRRGLPISVTVRPGPPPPGLAPILALYDDRQRENLLLGLDCDDLVLRVRYRADGWRLRRPEIRLREALAGRGAGEAVGDTIRLAARRPVEGGGPRSEGAAAPPRRSGSYCLSAGTEERCGLGFPPGRGWSLLAHPRGLSGAMVGGLDALWTGLLFLPLGLWGVRGLEGPRRRSAAAGPALAVAGLLAAPALTPLVAVGATEVVGALAGLAGGGLLGRWARRRSGPDDERGTEAAAPVAPAPPLG